MKITECINEVVKIKNKFVSNKICFRKVMFGICKGYSLPLNLSFQFRCFMGFYEMEICKFVKAYVKSGFCCYDVGASIGYYSIALSKLAAPGRIYSFEADKKCSDLLKDTITRNNNIKSEIVVLNDFVGNTINEDSMEVSIDWLVYEKNFPKPDFIKMDIEGAEYEAFLGARRLLKEFSPRIIVEVHSEDLRNNCKILLEEAGYKVLIVDQGGILPNRGDIYNGWLCCEKSI